MYLNVLYFMYSAQVLTYQALPFVQKGKINAGYLKYNFEGSHGLYLT